MLLFYVLQLDFDSIMTEKKREIGFTTSDCSFTASYRILLRFFYGGLSEFVANFTAIVGW